MGNFNAHYKQHLNSTDMIDFLMKNYEWMFSGVLSGLIFWFLGQKNGYKKAIKQSMKVGDNSTGVQVGRNYYNNSKKE